MDRVRFITHRGKPILLVDATNCTAEQVLTLADEVRRIVAAQPPSSVLSLTDFAGAQFSRGAVNRMKEVAVFDRPHGKRAAIVGGDSLPKVYYEALRTFSRREFPRFSTREEAMDWLTKHSNLGRYFVERVQPNACANRLILRARLFAVLPEPKPHGFEPASITELGENLGSKLLCLGRAPLFCDASSLQKFP